MYKRHKLAQNSIVIVRIGKYYVLLYKTRSLYPQIPLNTLAVFTGKKVFMKSTMNEVTHTNNAFENRFSF